MVDYSGRAYGDNRSSSRDASSRESSSRYAHNDAAGRVQQPAPRSAYRSSTSRVVVPNTERDAIDRVSQSKKRSEQRARRQNTSQHSRRSSAADVGNTHRSHEDRQHASSRSRASQTSSSRRASDSASRYSRDSYTRSAADHRRSRSPYALDPQPHAKRSGGAGKKIALGVVAVLAIVAIGVFAYMSTISNKLSQGVGQDVRNALVETEYSKEAFYMLLLGTDESEDRNENGDYGGAFRSDSMMLARIDCPNKKVTLISLERDTLIDMGEYGYNKLNAASLLGGPAYAIQVVSELAGVDISHYAQVDFDGFCQIVDTLGGIEVDVPMEIDDDDAGGYLAAGLQTLNGDQALILCRSRNTYNEYGSGNAYRSANQRLVLSAIAQKLLDSDVATIASSVNTLSGFISTDLSLTDIVGIAQQLRGLDMTTDMYTAMQPTTSVYENGMWYDVTDQAAWTTMIDRVNQGLPPTEGDVVDATGTVLATTGSGETLGGYNANLYENKRSGHVLVRNGGAVAGSGGVVGMWLENRGYTTDVDNADKTYAETLVVFDSPDRRSEALELARMLGVGKVLINNGDFTIDGDFLIILGADYES